MQKHVKIEKIMTFIVWVYTPQDVEQTQQKYARLFDRETVTFRNSG